MLLQRTMEYLLYLGVFILLIQITHTATVPEADDAISESSINAPPASHAAPTTSASAGSSSSSKRDAIKRAFADCRTQFSWMCLKIEFVKIMERLVEKEELSLAPGVSIVRNVNASEVKSNDLMAEVARSYPNDPNSRLNGYIMNKINNFLQSHSLRFKLIDTETMAEASSAVETGRKDKFGKKGGMSALIAAGLMMKGTLMAIGLGAIALLAGKALMTALMALTLSSALGLKGLSSGGSKSTTYEIIEKPVYTSSHMHSHDEGHGHMSAGGHSGSGSGYGGYARKLNLGLPNHLK